MARYTSQAPKASRPSLIPNGEYDGTIIGAEETVASTGSDMIEVKIEITMPDGSPGPIIYDNLVFTEAAGWKIDQFRAACGDEVVEGEDVEINPDDYIDRPVKVRVKAETFKGEKRNKIAEYVVSKAPF